MKYLLLAWSGNKDDMMLWLLFIVFLVLVIAGQALARWIFRRFFNKKPQ